MPGIVALPVRRTFSMRAAMLLYSAKLDAALVIVDVRGRSLHVSTSRRCRRHLRVATFSWLLHKPTGSSRRAFTDDLHRAAERASAVPTRRSRSSRVETVPAAQRGSPPPGFALDLKNTLATTRISLLGNQLTDLRELNALHALSRMIRDFLALHVPVVGGLLRKDRIHASVTRRRPFLLEGMRDADSELFMRLADEYLEIRRAQTRSSPEARADDRPFVQAASSSAVPLPALLSQYHRAHERYDVSWAAHVVVSGVRQVARHDVSQWDEDELTRLCSGTCADP